MFGEPGPGVGRKRYTADEKVAILRRHLVDRVPVPICVGNWDSVLRRSDYPTRWPRVPPAWPFFTNNLIPSVVTHRAAGVFAGLPNL